MKLHNGAAVVEFRSGCIRVYPADRPVQPDGGAWLSAAEARKIAAALIAAAELKEQRK